MKQGKVFFNPIDGSAPLSISWTSGPKGDAIESKNGLGVGFFSEKGDLLGVIFDDVNENKDTQFLEFSKYRIEVTTNRGRVTFKVHEREGVKKRSRSRKSPSLRKSRRNRGRSHSRNSPHIYSA